MNPGHLSARHQVWHSLASTTLVSGHVIRIAAKGAESAPLRVSSRTFTHQSVGQNTDEAGQSDYCSVTAGTPPSTL